MAKFKVLPRAAMHTNITGLIMLLHRSGDAAASSPNTARHPKMKPLIHVMYEKRKSGGGEGQWETGGG